MKKIVCLILTLLSLVLAASGSLRLSTAHLKQGGFFYLVYPAEKKYTIHFPYAPKSLKPFLHQGKKVVFVPVHYSTPAGTYPLVVKENEREIFTAEITVGDGNFKKSYLTVTKQMAGKRSDENLKAGSDKIGEAKKNSLVEKQWTGKFVNPAGIKSSNNFGAMRYVNKKVVGYHSGLDYSVGVGTPIKAANAGKVIFAQKLVTTGNTLVIDHGMNIFSSYSHLSAFAVKEGQIVKKGDLVGKSGATGFVTGPHLHFVISIGTIAVNPALFMEEAVLEGE
ncbi:MAG: M23 family metallopeptidase [Fusobacteriaceae bacterium]|jgi:murein DD-endopeptidase MepM/ murein hydrolase activator NlpD|nr:M23 family metallopeptidase [Fusobacteriaceae bacterium]